MGLTWLLMPILEWHLARLVHYIDKLRGLQFHEHFDMSMPMPKCTNMGFIGFKHTNIGEPSVLGKCCPSVDLEKIMCARLSKWSIILNE